MVSWFQFDCRRCDSAPSCFRRAEAAHLGHSRLHKTSKRESPPKMQEITGAPPSTTTKSWRPTPKMRQLCMTWVTSIKCRICWRRQKLNTLTPWRSIRSSCPRCTTWPSSRRIRPQMGSGPLRADNQVVTEVPGRALQPWLRADLPGTAEGWLGSDQRGDTSRPEFEEPRGNNDDDGPKIDLTVIWEGEQFSSL